MKIKDSAIYYTNGELFSCFLDGDQKIQGMNLKDGTEIYFYENGKIQTICHKDIVTINGNNYIDFDRDGNEIEEAIE